MGTSETVAPAEESFLGDINFLPNFGVTLGYNF